MQAKLEAEAELAEPPPAPAKGGDLCIHEHLGRRKLAPNVTSSAL